MNNYTFPSSDNEGNFYGGFFFNTCYTPKTAPLVRAKALDDSNKNTVLSFWATQNNPQEAQDVLSHAKGNRLAELPTILEGSPVYIK